MSPRWLPTGWELARIRLLFAAMFVGLLVVELALWNLQVARGREFQQGLARQSVRRVRIPGPRGRVFDCQGRPLADNRLSFSIALYLEELRPRSRKGSLFHEVQRTLDEVAAIIGQPPGVTSNDIVAHIRRRLPLPLVAWRDVSEAAVAKWAEMAIRIPGVDLYPEPVRVYPNGHVACHVLGYTRRAELQDVPEEPYHYYLADVEGASGVEKTLDYLLRGQAGVRLVRVNAAGYRYEDVDATEPAPGYDVQLTLDLNLQRAAESALDGVLGAIVVLDPADGSVLAMASRPAFDPNVFVPAPSPEQWNALCKDPALPLLNRAVAATYPPGSTFKPVVAMAALLSRSIGPNTEFSCPGYLTLGNARFRCWDNLGHGTLDMRHAIRFSCNVYFYHVGLELGSQAIAAAARAAGLGSKTGIDLEHEVAGFVPDPSWKRRTLRDAWRDGDTCNFAIGQGFLTATPIQMAVVASMIANGGRRVTPHLLKASRAPGAEEFVPVPPPAPQYVWPPSAIKVVQEGMRDVVMAPDGTGRRMFVQGYEFAGKTGTAEYGPKQEGRKRGWMIAFGPLPHPRWAAAMVVEDAVSGGITVAPRLQKFFAAAVGTTSTSEDRGS